jgi:hypothetical protein
MKVELEKRKAEIVRENKMLEETKETIKRLNLKHEEITGRLAEIDGDLVVAAKEQNAATAQFARGDISEDKLDGFHGKITFLNGKRTSIAGALVVVNGDLAAAMEKAKNTRDLLKRFEQVAWGLIADAELSKAAVLLRRAFAALQHGGHLGVPGSKSLESAFLDDNVYNAVFCSGGESYGLAAELLAREYLQ